MWHTEGASGHRGGQSSASLIPECLFIRGICTQDLCKKCFLILNRSLSLTFRVLYTTWAVSNSFLLCLQQAHWPDGTPTLAVPSSSLMPPAQCFSPTWDIFSTCVRTRSTFCYNKTICSVIQNFPFKASLEPLYKSSALFYQQEIGHIFTKV